MARDHGVRTVDVKVSGPGSGRESALRALASAGIEVRSIKDTTPIPHNGCRPPKRSQSVEGKFSVLKSLDRRKPGFSENGELATENCFRPGRRVKPNCKPVI